MADNITIKSYNEWLGQLVRKMIADTPANDIHAGSVLLTLLEAVAANDFDNNTAILNVLELLNIDSTSNNDLDALASNYGLTRYAAQKATGFITISDSSITKKSSTLYPIKPAPISGTRVLYVNDASDWDQIGKIYIGRDTQNFEGPIEYGNTGTVGVDKGIIYYGSYYAIYLDSALNNDHLISENVVWAQGTTDRRVVSGTTVKIPANNLIPDIKFNTIRDAVIPAGEDEITGVPVTAEKAGSAANAGINTVTKFETLPFATAEVTNTNAFTSGRDVETDVELRDRIKSYANSLARGTKSAILAAIEGLSDSDEGKRVASAVITEPVAVGDPSIIYVDDGSGFEPSYEGQSVDNLLNNATGNEEFLQLANFPLPRPQVVNVQEAPYELFDGAEFKVLVDDVEESIQFSSSYFEAITSATIYEIVTAINDLAETFKCRLTEDSTRLLIYPVTHDAETIQVIEDSTANAILRFPVNEFSYIKLYQNNELLTEKEKAAALTTIVFSSWNITSSGNLIISVDGTPPQDQTFTSADFGGKTFAALTLEDYVEAFNNKFAGITAVATTANKMIITSNREGSESALEILGGDYVNKMFAGVDLESEGQDSKFKLNRQNGALQILTDINANDTITAGSDDTKGSMISTQSSSGSFNVATDGSDREAVLVICPDAERVQYRAMNLPVASTITLTDQGSNVMRIMSSTTAAFQNVQPGDYIYIANRGHSAHTGTEAWIDEYSSGLFQIVTKGTHLINSVNTYVEVINYTATGMVVGSYAVVDPVDIQCFYSDVYPQIWSGSMTTTPAAASLTDIVTSINDNLRNVNASVYRTNSIRITSTTEEEGTITIPVSIGSATTLFTTGGELQSGNQSHIANKRPDKDVLSVFQRTDPLTTYLDRFVYTDIKGNLTSEHTPYTDALYGEILEDSSGIGIDNKAAFTDIISMNSGNNKNLFRGIRAIDSTGGSESVRTSQDIRPTTLMDYNIGDEYQIVKGLELSSDDNMVLIMDKDSVAKTVDIKFSRTGRVNSGSDGLGTGSGAIPNGSSFSADDYENEDNVDFSTLNVWGTAADQRNTNFNDYAVLFMARNWYISGGYTAPGTEPTLMIRHNQFGPIGDNFRLQFAHPISPSKSSTISHSNTPEHTTVTYTFGSDIARASNFQGGDQVTVTDLGSGFFRYTFPSSVNLNDVVADDVLGIGADTGFSDANSGAFSISAFVPASYTVDVYNPNGVATVVGVKEVTRITADSRSNTNDGEYFDIDAESGTQYRVYMDTTGANATIPAAGGRTLQRVDISVAADTAIGSGDAVATVLNTLADFDCPATGTGIIDCTDVSEGAVPDAANGNLGNAWTIATQTQGVDATYEVINIPTSINIFPINGTATSEIIDAINNHNVLNAVEIVSGDIKKATIEETTSGGSIAYGFTAGTDDHIKLYDSRTWVETFRNDVAPAYNFDVKVDLVLPAASPDPSVYRMDTTPVYNETETGELFKLVPVTIDNLKHHMTHKALSQLDIVSDINISDNLRKIQIKSEELGSSGAIEIVGGRANNAQFYIHGDADLSNVSGVDYLSVKVAAFPDTISTGDHVVLANDGNANRYSRLVDTDTIDVVEATSTEFEYRYNPKTTNFVDATTLTITDVSASYGAATGLIWRWTHSVAGIPIETLNEVNPGDVVAAHGTFTGWDHTNLAGITGSDYVTGLPIIAVDAASNYIDIINPYGVAMGATAIGASGDVEIFPTPIIEWRLSHGAPIWVSQIVVTTGTAVATFSGEHHLNIGDSFSITNNNATPTTGIVTQVDSPFVLQYATTAGDGTYTGGYMTITGTTQTKYIIQSLGYNNMFRLKAVSGDSPYFVDNGVAVDDVIVISGDTFRSFNNGEFRIVAVENDALIFQSESTQEELDTLINFNDEGTAVTWTANTNTVTGYAGNFRNIQLGDWVKKRDDEDIYYLQVIGSDTGNFETATSITLGGVYSGSSASSVGLAFDQLNDVGAGKVLIDRTDIRIFEGDSVRVNDSLYVSSTVSPNWFSPSNTGTFEITDIGTDPTDYKPYLRITNAAGSAESDIQMNVLNANFYINEGDDSKFTTLKQVAHVALDSYDTDKRIVYLTPGNRSYKWNQTNGTSISTAGKIGFDNDIVTGIDGYLYYTGLLRTIQRVVDGYEPDEISYPGRKGVGSAIEILPPLINRVTIVLDVTTKDGVNLSEITNEIKSAVINHINNLGVGDDVILSDIIVRAMSIDGVAAVTFVTPAASTERISIGNNEKAFITPLDVSIA